VRPALDSKVPAQRSPADSEELHVEPTHRHRGLRDALALVVIGLAVIGIVVAGFLIFGWAGRGT